MVSEISLLTSIAIRSAIVLVALVAGIRIFGKRQIGGMNIYDLVLVLLLANAFVCWGAGVLTVVCLLKVALGGGAA